MAGAPSPAAYPSPGRLASVRRRSAMTAGLPHQLLAQPPQHLSSGSSAFLVPEDVALVVQPHDASIGIGVAHHRPEFATEEAMLRGMESNLDAWLGHRTADLRPDSRGQLSRHPPRRKQLADPRPE